MQLLIRSQAALAHDLIRVAPAGDPAVGELTAERTRYRALVEASKNLGGRIGSGPEVLSESEQARALLRRVDVARPDELARAARLMRAIDDRLARHLLAGGLGATYVVSTGMHLGSPGPGGIRPAVTEWSRINSATDSGLLEIARSPRDPAPAPPVVKWRPTRAHLDATVVAATPARTALSDPTLGRAHRTTLSIADRIEMRGALRFASPEVQAATEDYLLRRPTRGGGVPNSKGAGMQPPPHLAEMQAQDRVDPLVDVLPRGPDLGATDRSGWIERPQLAGRARRGGPYGPPPADLCR